MMKLFDSFTGGSRDFIVKESDLIELMNMLDSALTASYFKGGITVRKAKSNCWNIDAFLTKNQWRAFLVDCKSKKYHLVIKDEPNKMYFVKGKESA